jgi:flagellin
MIAVATNTGAIMARYASSSVSNILETSMERLSSGKRINSAKDDAAGTAVAVGLDAQIRGTEQALRNVSDAIGLFASAEAGVSEINSLMQRMRELAVQSSNGVYTADDRTLMELEYQTLISAVKQRIANTKFNEQSLLDGTGGLNGNFEFKVGANLGNSISYDFPSIMPRKTSFKEITAVTAATSHHGDANNWQYVDVILSGPLETGMRISYTLTAADPPPGVGGQWLNEDAVNWTRKLPADQGYFDIVVDANGNLQAISSYSTPVYMEQWHGGQYAPRGAYISGPSAFHADTVVEFNMQWGGGYFTITDLKVEGWVTEVELFSSSILSQAEAASAVTILDGTMESMSQRLASYGATSNRFTSISNQLSATTMKLSQAKGRIVDADFATETSALARAGILHQAANAMLAQANIDPQNILVLLRG